MRRIAAVILGTGVLLMLTTTTTAAAAPADSPTPGLLGNYGLLGTGLGSPYGLLNTGLLSGNWGYGRL
ncbi:hypothetical protein AB0P36_35745 [Streptomyces flavidovirens]|uniref:hypothetical protein n=1 Tax=Streptomyces flavidovirens TaxID=67298 RepID=UPI00341A33D8